MTRYRTFDDAALLEKFGGDAGFVRGLFEVVLRTATPWPAALRDAAAHSDLANLAALAHKVKGTAGDLVADALQARARDAELAARSADAGAAGLGHALAEELENMLQEIRTAVSEAG